MKRYVVETGREAKALKELLIHQNQVMKTSVVKLQRTQRAMERLKVKVPKVFIGGRMTFKQDFQFCARSDSSRWTKKLLKQHRWENKRSRYTIHSKANQLEGSHIKRKQLEASGKGIYLTLDDYGRTMMMMIRRCVFPHITITCQVIKSVNRLFLKFLVFQDGLGSI